jgi:predicted nucleic acid-binding protein
VILVDTNIAGRLLQPTHHHFPAARNAVDRLVKNENESLCISAHSLYELAFILTKPVTNTFMTWKSLIAKYSIRNRPLFDAKLVATMIQNGVPRILTFNDKDFNYFTEIKALNPFDVLGVARIP